MTCDGTSVGCTHDKQNELLTIGTATLTYDGNGKQFVYDAWNRLVQVKSSTGTPLENIQYDTLRWEPIWSVYDPSSPCACIRIEPDAPIWFSMPALNPILFLLTAGVVLSGWWSRLLTVEEGIVSVLLLAIPYWTKGYENCMLSQARFALVVAPVYVVLGHWLARLRPPLATLLLALSGCALALFAALFAAGYKVF